MDQPNWAQAGFGLSATTIGVVLMLASAPWDAFGPVLVILGLLLVFFGLRPTWQSTDWYKRRQLRSQHGGVGPIRFFKETRLAVTGDRRWRVIHEGSADDLPAATATACVEAGVAHYTLRRNSWTHQRRLHRLREEIAGIRCEPFTDILPFMQAASSVVHGLRYGKLSSTAEDWRWEGEERTLQQAQAQLPSLPAEIRVRYSALLSKIGTILRDRAEPSSEEFQVAMSELEEQIERDRYLWDTELRRE